MPVTCALHVSWDNTGMGDVGQVTKTAVTAEDETVVMWVDPDTVGFTLEVAVIVAVASLVSVGAAVNTPLVETEPDDADHVTAWFAVPLTVASH